MATATAGPPSRNMTESDAVTACHPASAGGGPVPVAAPYPVAGFGSSTTATSDRAAPPAPSPVLHVRLP